MKKFLQSIFKGKTPDSASEKSTPAPAEASSPAAPAGGLTVEVVVADLRDFICTTVIDPISPEEVDPMLHLYDAGYVTSITAADLLAHIETRYGLDVSETQLVGRLQNLDALARHIVSPES